MRNWRDSKRVVGNFRQENQEMEITVFDIDQGVYLTRLGRLQADYHRHPAVEIIAAEKGDFTLSINNIDHRGVKFAVIEANLLHKLSFQDAVVNLLLLEHRAGLVRNFLRERNIALDGGHCLLKENTHAALITDILSHVKQTPFQSEYDTRVEQAVALIESKPMDYFHLKKALNQRIPLSESRLSHLFKDNTGVSIKRYFLWCKLKRAVGTHLQEKEGLFSSLIDAGFYDQPHFNNVYKSFIGTTPASTYYSRILQE